VLSANIYILLCSNRILSRHPGWINCFIFAAIVENVEPQLTGSTATSPRYFPLEKDAVKMISRVTKTVSDCLLLVHRKCVLQSFMVVMKVMKLKMPSVKLNQRPISCPFPRQSSNLVSSTLDLYLHCSHKPNWEAGDTLNPCCNAGRGTLLGASWSIGAEGVCSDTVLAPGSLKVTIGTADPGPRATTVIEGSGKGDRESYMMQCKVDWMGMLGSEQSREQHVDPGRQSQWLRSVTLEQELCHCRHLRPQCFNWHQAKFLCLRYNKGWVYHLLLNWACGSSVDRGREYWRQGCWIGEEMDKKLAFDSVLQTASSTSLLS